MFQAKTLLFILLLSICTIGANAQSIKTVLDSLDKLYKQKKYNQAISYADAQYSKFKNENNLFDILYQQSRNQYKIDKEASLVYLWKINQLKTIDSVNTSKLYYRLGLVYNKIRQQDSALYFLFKALKYNNSPISELHAKINYRIAYVYDNLDKNNLELNYLNKAISITKVMEDTNMLLYLYNSKATCFTGLQDSITYKIDSSLYYYKKALTLKTPSKKEQIRSLINQNIGAVYLGHHDNLDSAKHYFNKALNYKTSPRELANIYMHKAIIASKNKNLKLAIKHYHNSKSYASKINDLELLSYIEEDLSNLYEQQSNNELALKHYKSFKTLNDSISKVEVLKNSEDIQTKYETEKKEKENIQLQADIKEQERQKRTLWVVSLIIIVFGFITAFLIYKNIKRKQKLAERNKELETQKLVAALKDQELASIDAMITGQEKERQRIANDLHDDLGGLMATIKLHFNAFKDKQSPELFNKTTTLLDDAYQKIRSIAHAKNSGVIANQGLLKAIKTMAQTISVSNQIQIQVHDHGLQKRLENSLELTLFRIIQELITNIIKHAHASEATIHLTNHDDVLNIMVEDNGIGFNPKHLSSKTHGMGINSIDKRIDHLNGTMTIESEPNKGTTIIIDIPL